MKHLIIFLLLSSCNRPQANPQNVAHEFDFDLCNTTFNGKVLPFDQPLAEWVKVLGKYDRSINNFHYIWDSLGVVLSKSNFSKNGTLKNKENPDELLIFYQNLKSPLWQAKKLEYANGYQIGLIGDVLRRNQLGEYEIYAVGDISKPLGNDSLKYVYPIKVHSKPVFVDSSLINGGMSLSEVNDNRSDLDIESEFGYWDKDSDWKDERGSTKVKTGQFCIFSIDGEKSKCGLEKNHYYLTTLRYSEGILEYVKVEKVTKGFSRYWHVYDRNAK
jgi:hypothetical protein